MFRHLLALPIAYFLPDRAAIPHVGVELAPPSACDWLAAIATRAPFSVRFSRDIGSVGYE